VQQPPEAGIADSETGTESDHFQLGESSEGSQRNSKSKALPKIRRSRSIDSLEPESDRTKSAHGDDFCVIHALLLTLSPSLFLSVYSLSRFQDIDSPSVNLYSLRVHNMCVCLCVCLCLCLNCAV